ncbi:MAG TPA: acetylxylan esterase [Sphingobacteriaceae bacterium]|nr:acetylxylan esterase [Sphingobacteriaceae bacterium]
MVTALDKRVNAVAAYCPALCQTNGTSYGKAEGWPKPTVRFGNSKLGMAAHVEKTIAYYDVCNFVEDIGVPIFMTWGLIDDVTPASTIFGAYNRISAPKNNLLMPNIAHANDRSQIDAVHDFIFKSVR